MPSRSPTLFDLTGRTALITGSVRGIGFAFARGLAQAGARVILNGRNKAALDEAVGKLSGEGLSVLGLQFDVADEAAITGAFKRLDDQNIPVDILINNAGIQFRKPMVDLALADWERVLNTNLTAAFLVGREAARRMLQRGQGGKVINICSLTSEMARNTVAPYTAAKGGLKMLTRSMAVEWGPHNVQTNGIGPGYIATEMNRALIDDAKFDAWVKASNPAQRWGQPEELVGAAIFLSSAASNYVNGQIIYVDGGWLAVL
jgi:gluconate 5-dehydrogenase